MVDNTTLPGTGDTYASNDIAGIKYQRVKISVGAAGSAADNDATHPIYNSPIAGTNGDIGKTNIRHVSVLSTTLTRPANTTAYSANDSVSDNATAASVTALPITVSDTNDDPIDLTEILLDSTDTGFGAVQVKIHLFNSDPTASSGVGAGDNAAWLQKRAGWAGSFTGTLVSFSDGSKGVLIPDGGPLRVMNVETGGKRIWWQLQTLGAATPSAASTTFTLKIRGYQGRL